MSQSQKQIQRAYPGDGDDDSSAIDARRITRSDERITEDVNERLTQDHEFDASNIRVETKDGEVTLKGTVSDLESKRRAEDIANSCSGVKAVQNQLRISTVS